MMITRHTCYFKLYAHPRYFLGGHRPSETGILTFINFSLFLISKKYTKDGVNIFSYKNFPKLKYKNLATIRFQ
jgi:hypothetical protein